MLLPKATLIFVIHDVSSHVWVLARDQISLLGLSLTKFENPSSRHAARDNTKNHQNIIIPSWIYSYAEIDVKGHAAG